MVLPSGKSSEGIHLRLYGARHLDVERVDRLARLEKRVRVVRGPADEWVFRVKRSGSMGAHQIVADHGADVGVAQQAQSVDLMRGAEPVEEMQERNACLQRSGLAIKAASCASCTEPDESRANPVVRTVMTSEWSPKIDKAEVATERAAT